MPSALPGINTYVTTGGVVLQVASNQNLFQELQKGVSLSPKQYSASSCPCACNPVLPLRSSARRPLPNLALTPAPCTILAMGGSCLAAADSLVRKLFSPFQSPVPCIRVLPQVESLAARSFQDAQSPLIDSSDNGRERMAMDMRPLLSTSP